MIEFNPKTSFTPNLQYEPFQSKFSQNVPDYLSTIRSEKKGNAVGKLVSLLTTPIFFVLRPFIAMLKWIQERFFCCFSCSGRNSLNWQETKDIFEGICTAVLTAKATTHSTTRDKQFQKKFGELSSAAQERFREHVGFVLAKKEGISDRAKQMKWMKEHPVNDEDYFRTVEKNDVLRQAVEAFRDEINQKTGG